MSFYETSFHHSSAEQPRGCKDHTRLQDRETVLRQGCMTRGFMTTRAVQRQGGMTARYTTMRRHDGGVSRPRGTPPQGDMTTRLHDHEVRHDEAARRGGTTARFHDHEAARPPGFTTTSLKKTKPETKTNTAKAKASFLFYARSAFAFFVLRRVLFHVSFPLSFHVSFHSPSIPPKFPNFPARFTPRKKELQK